MPGSLVRGWWEAAVDEAVRTLALFLELATPEG